MLISHRHRFIYTKTVKTAGTSVESYFEPHCMRPGEWEHAHGRGEYESEAGVIGVRSGDPLDLQAATWWNHMPAATIRAQAGDDVWAAYFKFCVVRNPFDALVSAYRHFGAAAPVAAAGPSRGYLRGLFARPKAETNPGDPPRADFERWLRSVRLPLDRNKYLIDGRFCLDHVIRYESLLAGIEEVCGRLGLPFEPQRLPKLKVREKSPWPLAAYYSPASIDIVERAYRAELDLFGYKRPW